MSMKRSDIRDELGSALDSFYRDHGVRFWEVFEETPRAAVAAFKSNPEVFGALDPHYVRWAKSRVRQHERLSGQLELLLEAVPSYM